MKNLMFNKKYLASIALLLGASTVNYASNTPNTCPVLTAKDVKWVIERAVINTDRSYTLADEVGASPAEVLQEEPTANPFDNFYSMYGVRSYNNREYAIYVGNVLGKDNYEAQHRAKKILIKSGEDLNGIPVPGTPYCLYKEIDARPFINGYPFKSHYESIVLVGIELDQDDEGSYTDLNKKMTAFVKHRAR